MVVIDTIQEMYNSFSDKEKDIAKYILQQGDKISNINIVDLAKLTGTSGATITRFCKKIECDSFVDMKIKINSTKRDVVNPDIKKVGILEEVYSYYNKVIERTSRVISSEQIIEVSEKIKKANKIYIYGVGSSGFTTSEMMQRLLRMGFNVYSISDSHMMIINSSIVAKGDLVIGISISGETEEVVSALKIAKANGADIVTITSFKDSSVYNIGDLNLLVYNTVFVDNKRFVNSQFATMYVIDLISVMLLEEKKLSGKMQKTIEAITNEYL